MNELERMLRDDLHRVADSVDIPVSLDAIAAEYRRVERRAAWRRRVLVVLTVLAALAVVVLLTRPLWSRTPDRAVPNPLQTPSAGLAPTAAPEPTVGPTDGPAGPTASGVPGRTVGLFVYFMAWAGGADTGDPMLVRELRQVPALTPARGGLEAMLAGPVDPDYLSGWNPATHILGIAQDGDLVTVDLSGEALDIQLGLAGEQVMVAQLVYTVTEAFSATDRVRILVEGQTFESGHHVYDQPLTRGAANESLMRVVIDSPVHGSTVASPVAVTGLAAAFEATIHWSLVTSDGAPVADGFAMTDEGQTLAPYSFELPPLEPGTYVVAVTLDDPSGGLGPPPARDSKEFTVPG